MRIRIRIRNQGLIFKGEKAFKKCDVLFSYIFTNLKRNEYYLQKVRVLSFNKVKKYVLFSI